MSLDPAVMTGHGGWPVTLQRGRGLPPHTLSDFTQAWQFPDAPSMVAAFNDNRKGEEWLTRQSATLAGTRSPG